MTRPSEHERIVQRISLTQAETGPAQDWWTVIEAEGDRAMIVLARQEYPGALSMMLKAMTAYTGDSIALGKDNRPTGNFITHSVISEGHEVKHFTPEMLGRAIQSELSPPLPTDEHLRRDVIAEFVTAAWTIYEASTAYEASVEIIRSNSLD